MHLKNKQTGGMVLDILFGLVTPSSNQPHLPNTGQPPLTGIMHPQVWDKVLSKSWIAGASSIAEVGMGGTVMEPPQEKGTIQPLTAG